jgi:hypothetical protein
VPRYDPVTGTKVGKGGPRGWGPHLGVLGSWHCYNKELAEHVKIDTRKAKQRKDEYMPRQGKGAGTQRRDTLSGLTLSIYTGKVCRCRGEGGAGDYLFVFLGFWAYQSPGKG